MEKGKQSKTVFVLEGGAMRGLYSAGVLDVFMQNGITTDAIYGVSAGALFGINFKSKQIGRAIRYNLKYAHEKNYMGLYSLVTTGNIMNEKFCFDRIVNELDKFDFDTFFNTLEYVAFEDFKKTSNETSFKVYIITNQFKQARINKSIIKDNFLANFFTQLWEGVRV